MTPIEWVAAVMADPIALLSDHAHCELKAASAIQSMIVTYPDRLALVQQLGPVAVEELQHFNRVHGVLVKRGEPLRASRPSPYADGLGKAARQGRQDLMLDRLLLAGLIEERSFERFGLLAEHCGEAELCKLYRELMLAEEHHRRLFVEIAKEYYPSAQVDKREQQLRAAEATVMRSLPCEARMHSGPAPLNALQGSSLAGTGGD